MKYKIGGTSTHKWKTVLGWSLGWAIAWSATRWMNIGLWRGIPILLNGALGGGIGGFIGAVGMSHLVESLEDKGKLTIAWVISMAFSEAVAWELGQFFAADFTWILIMAIGGALAGALGGSMIASLRVRFIELGVKHRFHWILAFAIGGLAGSIVVHFIAPFFSGILLYQDASFAGAIIAQFFGGLACGLIGGLIGIRRA